MSTVAARNATNLWHLDRIDHGSSGSMDGLYTYEHTGTGVHIYIIDSGISASLSEFGSRLQTGYNSHLGISGNTGDSTGHGTGVAAVAAGAVHGVASGAYIVPVKTAYDTLGHSTLGDFIDGINWVATNHVSPAVANISSAVTDAFGVEITNQDVDDAVDALIQAGVTVVVAAGNQNKDACNVSPARVGAAVTVGAIDNQDTRASFSNWGTCVDLYAPGQSIRTLTYDASETVSSGTSFAAPGAAGVAALDLEQFSSDSPGAVAGILRVAARAKSSGTDILYSLVPIPMFGPFIDGPSIVHPNDFCSWTAGMTGGHGPFSYQWSGVGSGTGSQIQTQVPSTSDLTVNIWDALGGHVIRTVSITADWNKLPGCDGPPLQH